MTALYVNQNVFSIFEEFFVKDSKGKNRYRVTGMPLSLTRKLNIYDEKGQCAATVEKPVFSILPDTYDIFVHGKKKAVIHARVFSIFPWVRHQVGIVNWDVTGLPLDHDFTVTRGFSTVASIHKKWMSFGDCYELHVAEGEDELIALAVMIGLNAIQSDHDMQKKTAGKKK